MKAIDLTERNIWRSDVLGKAIPDPDFNPYSVDSQKFIKNLCLDMHAHEFIIQGSVNCWWTDFENYMA